MPEYRITKYNPKLRNEKGYYMKEEWTSCSDIGRMYNDGEFTAKEYLSTEKKYLQTIAYILKKENVQSMTITGYERGLAVRKTQRNFEKCGLHLQESEKRFLRRAQNGMEIPVGKLPWVLRLLLRECFWCVLKDPVTGCKIEVDFDYYVYVRCHSLNQKEIERFAQDGIYIENMKNVRTVQNEGEPVEEKCLKTAESAAQKEIYSKEEKLMRMIGKLVAKRHIYWKKKDSKIGGHFYEHKKSTDKIV